MSRSLEQNILYNLFIESSSNITLEDDILLEKEQSSIKQDLSYEKAKG